MLTSSGMSLFITLSTPRMPATHKVSAQCMLLEFNQGKRAGNLPFSQVESSQSQLRFTSGPVSQPGPGLEEKRLWVCLFFYKRIIVHVKSNQYECSKKSHYIQCIPRILWRVEGWRGGREGQPFSSCSKNLSQIYIYLEIRDQSKRKHSFLLPSPSIQTQSNPIHAPLRNRAFPHPNVFIFPNF